MGKGLKWEPAVPIKKPDNLISSPLFHNMKQFQPSYQKEDPSSYNMYFLLSWEYGRVWFNENRKWEKLMYGKESKGTKELFRRGHVHKHLPKKVTIDVPETA